MGIIFFLIGKYQKYFLAMTNHKLNPEKDNYGNHLIDYKIDTELLKNDIYESWI